MTTKAMTQTVPPSSIDTGRQAGLDVELQNVVKIFAGEPAVQGIDLEVHKGEFFSILGPSGCGKTTILRMIAGFETPTSGELRIQGRSMTQVPPYQRPVNTVFQSYALFSHLNVADNIAFGLKIKNLSRSAIQDRVRESLRLVQLESLSKRFPNQLSGGQQQRVALARALINRPAVLLLDEPLGALDLKLRKEMQMELTRLHRQLKMTFVMVTHDQEEALSMSDRIAVVAGGKIEQVGTPSQIYDRPQSQFVAEFIGDTNLIPGRIEGSHPSMLWIKTDEGQKLQVQPVQLGDRPLTSGRVMVNIRPEKIKLHRHPPNPQVNQPLNYYEGAIVDVMYLGTHVNCVVQTRSGLSLIVRQPTLTDVDKIPGPVYLTWEPQDCLAIPN